MTKLKLDFAIFTTGALLLASVLTSGTWINKTEAGLNQTQATLDNLQFQYSVVKEEDGSYTVFYNFAQATTADVQKAVGALNHTAETLANHSQPFKATLVFARPLPVEEFRAFMRSTNVTPTANTVRGIDALGHAMEMGIPPEWGKDMHGRPQIGKPISGGEPFDDKALARINQGHNSFRVVGVVSTEVTLDAAISARVQRDPRVYAIDVMEQVLIEKVRQSEGLAPTVKIDVVGPVIYAAMENTGLAPKVAP